MDNAPILHQVPAGLTERAVEEVQARRASLRQACAGVREAVRTSSGGAPAGAVLTSVQQLGIVWRRHTVDTERPEGVLEQILADCPRLSPTVSRLRREHQALADALRAMERLLDPPVTVPVDPVAPMPALTELLQAVDRHRRHGRELIYDAYHVDLGLGE
jgi:hypothetical protein